MSVERRPSDLAGQPTTFDREVEPAETAETIPTGSARIDSPRTLAARIERTKLLARITALERELAASECRRQAIVGQYELLLEERDCDCDRTTRSSDRRPTALLRRLL